MALVSSARGTGSHFLGYVLQRIERNKNFLCAITGETGSGKSYSAMYLGEQLDPNFSIKNVCFSVEEFMLRIEDEDVGKGSVLVLDEAGVAHSAHEWQRVENRVFNYLLQVFRHMNLIVFFTLPDMRFLAASSRRLIHSHIETISINPKKKLVKLKPLLIQIAQRTGKEYRKYLRVQLAGQGVKALKRINVGMPSKELVKAYEARKNEYSKELRKSILQDIRKTDKKPLTERQQELLGYIKDGNSPKELLQAMGFHERTLQSMLNLIRQRGYNVRAVRGDDARTVIRYEVVEDV